MRPHRASTRRAAFIARKLLLTLGLTTLVAIPATLIPLHADGIILYLTGINGENTQKGREKSIVVSEMTWEVENNSGKGGAVASPTVYVKLADSTSPYVFERLVNGVITPSALFRVYRPNISGGGGGVEYLVQDIEFKNVRFISQSEHATTTSSTASSTETLKMVYESLKLTGNSTSGATYNYEYAFPAP